MTTKRTTVDSIEVTEEGDIGVRLSLDYVDQDGAVVGHREPVLGLKTGRWHRCMIPAGEDVSAYLAMVSANLADAYGWAPISEQDVASIAAQRLSE